MTPAERTVRWLRASGWFADHAERQTGPVKRDWMGFADVIAFHPDLNAWLLVQVTTASHFADRVKKVYRNQWARLLVSQNQRVQIHGWKAKGKEPCVREMGT